MPTYVSGTKPAKSGLFLLGGPCLCSWPGEAWTNSGSIIIYLLIFPRFNYKHIGNRDLISLAPKRVIGTY